MKPTVKILGLLLSGIWMFSACDTIPEEERLIRIQETTEEVPIAPGPSKQRVLLEDYTGWRCTNCPSAAKTIAGLQEKFSDNLVVMAIHGTSFARPNAENHLMDLRTPQGNAWIEEFGISGLPIGMVNRNTFSGSLQVLPANWESSISSILSDKKKHVTDFNMGISLKSKENRILVSTETIFLQDYSGALNLSLVVIENQIHGVQKNDDPAVGAVPRIDDFIFNHVMRNHGSFDNTLMKNDEHRVAGDTIKKSYELTASEEWNLKNCQVVGFLSSPTTKEIIQVNIISVP